MVVKTVHLELVNSPTTKAFLVTLKRFISGQYRPSDVYLDKRSNLVGARNELPALIRIINGAVSQNFGPERALPSTLYLPDLRILEVFGRQASNLLKHI